jgi:Zn-dependent peptidase ImmA (M78 family)
MNNIKLILITIWLKYNKEYTFFFDNCNVAHCYLVEKEIHFPMDRFNKPNSRDVFDMLHEIGHLKTNKKGMKRCEEEFYATQWAIKEMKKYKLKLSDVDKKIFQDYIWNWRNTSIKLKGKNVPSKEHLTLTW